MSKIISMISLIFEVKVSRLKLYNRPTKKTKCYFQWNDVTMSFTIVNTTKIPLLFCILYLLNTFWKVIDCSCDKTACFVNVRGPRFHSEIFLLFSTLIRSLLLHVIPPFNLSCIGVNLQRFIKLYNPVNH